MAMASLRSREAGTARATSAANAGDGLVRQAPDQGERQPADQRERDITQEGSPNDGCR